MTYKSFVLFIIFVFMSQYVQSMEQAPAQTPQLDQKPAQTAQPEETTTEKNHKGAGHKDRSSVIINIAVDEAPLSMPRSPVITSRIAHHHKTPSISNITSVTIQPTPSSLTCTSSVPARPNSVTFQVDMQDLAHATPAQIEKLVDDLIRRAGLATFDAHDENAFYVQHLKATLLQSFTDYIKTSGQTSPDSSTSSISDTPPPANKHRKHSLIKEEAVSKIRHDIFERLNTRHTVPQDVESQISEGEKSVSANVIEHKDLKEWFLRELELHDLKIHEQEKELKEKADENKEKLEDSRRKTKYAIATTVATTLCGAITTLVTYFTTQALDHGSN